MVNIVEDILGVIHMKKISTLCLFFIISIVMVSCAGQTGSDDMLSSSNAIPDSSVSSDLDSSRISENSNTDDKQIHSNLEYKAFEGKAHTLTLQENYIVSYKAKLPSNWLPRHNYSTHTQLETYSNSNKDGK